MDILNKKSVVAVCANPGSQQQSVWKNTDLGRLFFSTTKSELLSKKMADAWKDIQEVHRLIWPGIAVPESKTFDVDAKDVHFRSIF